MTLWRDTFTYFYTHFWTEPVLKIYFKVHGEICNKAVFYKIYVVFSKEIC